MGTLITFGIFSERTYALLCNNNGSMRHDIVLDQPIRVNAHNARPGTLLWCSPDYTMNLQCNNDRTLFSAYNGLAAHIYWNPHQQLNQIHPSIEINVKYNGIYIKPLNGSSYLGRGTGYLDTPLPLSINYSICIKATGKMPPEDGRINDNHEYLVFQINDQYNPRTNNSFNTYISGLSNIYFSCLPRITVMGNNASIINFGTVSKQKASVGTIAKQVPFSIIANMNGQDCLGNILEAKFTPTSPTVNNNIILPGSNSGVGIFLSNEKTPDMPIMLNTPVEFDLSTTSSVEKKLFANLQWLSKDSTAGPFNTSANINVTIK